MRCRFIPVLFVVFVVSSCAGGETDERSTTSSLTPVPVVTAQTTEVAVAEANPGGYPYGLSADSMPEGLSELMAVFDEMPGELDGLSRSSEVDGLAAQYGDFNGLFAAEVASEVGGPSMVDMMSAFEQAAGVMTEASKLDTEDGLLWVFGSFEDQGGAGVVHVAMWGEPDGDCVFSINAESPEMRTALIEAYLEAVAADVVSSPEGDSLTELREALLTQAEFQALLDVSELSVDVVGGPDVGDPGFEHSTVQPVGGYFVMFRNPAGMADTGTLALSLFENDDSAAAAVAERLGIGVPDAVMLRSEFDVGHLFVQCAGYILDPEPDSHFTEFIGRVDSTVVSLVIFHGEDDDRVTEAQAIAAMIGERLEAMQ